MSPQMMQPMHRRVAQTALPSRSLGRRQHPPSAQDTKIASPTLAEHGLGHDLSRVSIHAPRARAAESCPLPAGPRACPYGGACHTCPTQVQAKLAIGRPDDEYEQEADRVAEQVMRVPDSALCEASRSTGSNADGRMQPACSKCSDDDEEAERLRTKPVPGRALVAPKAGSERQVPNGDGQPLDPAIRAFMEPRFGYDLGQVRVHADAKAAESARATNALAYTVGRDIVFGVGEYAPQTEQGRRLLAHELTHVVQQSGVVGGASPPVRLMRTIAYDPDCQPRQDEVEGNVPRAQASAARWALAAAAALATPQDVASLLRRHFNVEATDTASVGQIRNIFETIASCLSSDGYTYHCRPDSDSRCQEPDGEVYAGFAYPGGFDIYFCDPYPYQDFFGHKSLIDTVLHEAAHAHDSGFNHDTYEHESGYPGPSPLTNADSYSSFARDAALGVGAWGVEVSVGGLMAADPQFYIAVGVAGDVGGPVLDLFNLRVGARLAFMPGSEGQPFRAFEAVDLGLRINPIRARVYVDLTTGAFFGANFTDSELMAGIANRLSAGYRGERMDLGLDLAQFYDFLSGENLVIVGVMASGRF